MAPRTRSPHVRQLPQEISSAEQLALALRRIVREEMGKPAEPSGTGSDDSKAIREFIAIALLVVNLLLVYAYLPVNNDVFEFAKFLAAGLGGGLAISNPGALRSLLEKATSIQSFVPVNLALLVVLCCARFGRLPLRFDVEPKTARIIVDGDKDHPRRSNEAIWLNLGKHSLKLHPGSGSIIVGLEQTKIEDRDLEIHWTDVIRGPWTLFSPEHLGMLLRVSVSFSETGMYRLSIHSPSAFDAPFRVSNGELTFTSAENAYLDTKKTDQVFFTVPFGTYSIQAVSLDDSNRKCTYAAVKGQPPDGKFHVDSHTNTAEMECKP